MTRSAERHEISLIVRSSPGHRNDVMTLHCRNHPPFLEAAFTVRMRQHVSVPNPSPGPAVLPMHVFCPLVSVVLPSLLCPVRLTVLTIRQVRTPRVRTRTQWFPWHVLLQTDIRKASRNCSHEAIYVHSIWNLLYYLYPMKSNSFISTLILPTLQRT